MSTTVSLTVLPPVLTAAEKKDARARAKLAKEDVARQLAEDIKHGQKLLNNAQAAQDASTTPAKSRKEIAAAKHTTPTKAERKEGQAKVEQTLDAATDVPRETKTAPAIPGAGYQGPMLALRDRLKAGSYKKAANGQPSCGDEVANVLGHLEPLEVIRACLIALDIANPYLHLNIGQQSMNLRNKLRGALKHEKFGMGVLREAVEEVIEGRPAKASPADNT